jgi:MFS family permease
VSAPSSPRRRGWGIVAALSVTETTSWGVLYYGFPVFLKPMEAEFGWSRATLTGAFSLALVVQGVTAVAVGRWLDRHSPRAVMTAGSVAATALVVAWSRVDTVAGFYVVWAAVGAVMATVLYEPAFTVIAKWFHTERTRALTAVTMVAALASFVFLPLENRLIRAHGWRDALLVLAVVLGVVTVPLHALVLRPPPDGGPLRHEPGPGEPAAVAAAPEHTTREALRLRSFWLLAASLVGMSFVTSALAVHQVAYLTERGYASSFAAGVTGILGAMQLPGRVLFAPLLRRLSRRAVTTLVFGLLCTGLAVLVASTARVAVWTFVLVYGTGRGMVTLLRATLVGDLFGARHYGGISGVLAGCTTVAAAASPLVAATVYDRLGDYRAVLWLLLAVAVLTMLAASRIEAGQPAA